MSNQEVKDVSTKMQKCTNCVVSDFEITKSRIVEKCHGDGAESSDRQKIVRISTSAEDVAFLLDFLHNPETD